MTAEMIERACWLAWEASGPEARRQCLETLGLALDCLVPVPELDGVRDALADCEERYRKASESHGLVIGAVCGGGRAGEGGGEA